MKKLWISLILAAAAAGASGAGKPEPDIVVWLHIGNENPSAFRFAETQAERILARAGISVAWHMGSPKYYGPAEVIEVVLSNPLDQNFDPGALAYAMPGRQSGTRIEVFYNRVRSELRDSEVPPVLAHVLAHEITHILEGVVRHSDTGVMKSHWDSADHRRMRVSPLPFADEDLRLIHAWVERHNRVLLAGMR